MAWYRCMARRTLKDSVEVLDILYVCICYVCRTIIPAVDTKLTLSFDAGVADRAKAFAEANNISLSRLIEFMLSKVTDKRYRSLDELPVSDWISQVAEGEVTYVRKNAAERNVKKDYLASRRRSR